MSPRVDIRMSEADVDRFLASQQWAVVAAAGDGAPRGARARFRHDAGGTRFILRAEDPVVALLDADDRTCCVVDQFPSYYGIVGVMLHGRAAREPEPGPEPGGAAYRLVVEKVVSFDFGKLRAD